MTLPTFPGPDADWRAINDDQPAERFPAAGPEQATPGRPPLPKRPERGTMTEPGS